MKIVLNPDYSQIEDFVNDLPSGGFEHSGELIYDGRNSVKVFELEDGQKIAVKKFKQPHTLNRFVYTFFRGTKAERAYNNAFKLEKLKIDTPKAIAYIDVFENGIVTVSYLVTEFTDYAPVRDIVREDSVYQVMLFDALMKFTVKLHSKGISHDDYNDTNVRYKKTLDGEIKFILIDINRMRFGPMTKYHCLSNLKRLCTKPKVTYNVATKYAELRGWNGYTTMASLALMRSVFESRRETRRQLKDAIRGTV